MDSAPLRPHRRQSPPLLNPVVLILLIPTLALIIILLLITSFIPHTPNIKTKGLDYLNLILLLFAILCGLFPKRTAIKGTKSRPMESSQWHECPDPKAESGSPATGLRRNSSYPDIRQTTDWETGYDQLWFFDDFEPDKYRLYNRRSEAVEKVIPVDTFEAVRSSNQIRSDDKKLNRSEMKIKRKCKQKIRNIKEEKENIAPPQKMFSPPPPPPPPTLSFYGIFKKGNKNKKGHSLSPVSPPLSPRLIFNEIFKSGSKSKQFQNESRSVPPPPPPPFSSFINNISKIGSKSKRFLHQSKSPSTHPSSIFNDIIKIGSKSKRFETQSRLVPPPPPPSFSSIINNISKIGSKSKRFLHQSKTPQTHPSSIFNDIIKFGSESKRFQSLSGSVLSPPPPPPLPPPPSSVFNNLFKSGSKSKRYQKNSTSAPSPPAPPPPPPSSLFNNIFKTKGKSKRFSTEGAPPAPHRWSSSRPPLPAKTGNLYGGGCPTPESREKYPERSEEMNGGDPSRSMVMCPSPDVNMKADSFIARLKGDWRLEKINSVREKMNRSPQSSPRA